MYEELGILKVNRLSNADRSTLVLYLRDLVKVCLDSLARYRKAEQEEDEFFEGISVTSELEKAAAVVNEQVCIGGNYFKNLTDREAKKEYNNVKELLRICDNLNGYDFFGTEGWQHHLGLD